MKSLLYCSALAAFAAVSLVSSTSDGSLPEAFGPSISRDYIVDPSIVVGSSVLPTTQVSSFSRIMEGLPVGAVENPVAIAIDFAKAYYPGQNLDFVVKNAYTTDSNGVTHVYLRQLHEGREIINADMNINVWKGQVISMGDSFYKPSMSLKEKKRKRNGAVFSPVDALRSARDFFSISNEESLISTMSVHPLEDKHEEVVSSVSYSTDKYLLKGVGFANHEQVPCVLAYVLKEDNTLELVWNMELDLKDGTHWYSTQVSVDGGDVVAFVDWVSHFTNNEGSTGRYVVYPQYVPSPIHGDRVAVDSPADVVPSPKAWHTIGSKTYTDTQGNNVRAQLNPSGGNGWQNNHRPNAGKSLNFDFPANLPEDGPKQIQDAAVTNLFYWNNIMHDIFHRYGFDEKAGNFQDENYGRGGAGGDGVIANAQDGSGTNNANFATPPDGSRPRMRMYVWTLNTPNRDGDLESPIVMHEYGHGISIRLTGGPANSGCLGYGEAGGMGEGWSDFFGLSLHMRESYNRNMTFLMGDYAYNGKTIRRYPYSTDMQVNPETYGYIKRPPYYGVHAKGEVWAMTLLEAYWNFVDAYGYDADWRTGKGGNNRILKNVVDGLKLQPCQPNFVSARNAILQADKVNFNGEGQCLLWKAFAKRGLGAKASSGGKEDFSLPTECSTSSEEQNIYFF